MVYRVDRNVKVCRMEWNVGVEWGGIYCSEMRVEEKKWSLRGC